MNIFDEKKAVELRAGYPTEKYFSEMGGTILPFHRLNDSLVVASVGSIMDALVLTNGLSGNDETCIKASKPFAGKVSVIKSGEGSYLATLKRDDGSHVCVATAASGKLRAVLKEPDGSLSLVKATGVKADPDFFLCTALVYIQLVQEKFGNIEFITKDNLKDSGTDKAVEELYMAVNDVTIDIDGLAPGIVAGNVTGLTNQTLQSLASGDIVLGEQKGVSGYKEKANPKTFGEASKLPLFEKFREEISDRHTEWTDSIRAMIPSFDDDALVMKEAVELAKRYVMSKSLKRPFVNVGWRGITSYGKSTGVEQMAALLGMPLFRVTCHTTMETTDFLTSFIPDNTGNTKFADIPDLATAVNCPDIAYEMLTGCIKDDATVEEVQELMFQALASRNCGNNAKFKLVESPFVQALLYGGLVEVQEVSRIRDPGIMVGLNEYDRAGARIPKCDGSYGIRHQDALVVYTDNVGYNSCRPLDPSVLRRMSVIIDSTEMTEETVLERIRHNVPGFNDVLLRKMYSVWEKIQKYCQENGIDGGCCSVSELEMWVACVAMDDGENIIENCQNAVISKATADPIDQAAILAAVKTMGCPESIMDVVSVGRKPII